MSKTSSNDNSETNPYVVSGKIKFGYLGWKTSIIIREKGKLPTVKIIDAVV